jgi:hypothetical protein
MSKPNAVDNWLKQAGKAAASGNNAKKAAAAAPANEWRTSFQSEMKKASAQTGALPATKRREDAVVESERKAAKARLDAERMVAEAKRLEV